MRTWNIKFSVKIFFANFFVRITLLHGLTLQFQNIIAVAEPSPPSGDSFLGSILFLFDQRTYHGLKHINVLLIFKGFCYILGSLNAVIRNYECEL